VGLLVAQAAEELHGGVPLLGRRLLILGEDGVDEGVEGAEDGSGRGLGAGVGLGLRVGEDLADLAAGGPGSAGGLADWQSVAVCQSDLGVVVHRQHPCLRSAGPVGDGAYWNGCGWGGSILYSPRHKLRHLSAIARFVERWPNRSYSHAGIRPCRASRSPTTT